MRFDVELGDRRRAVSVRRQGDRLRVSIDGHVHVVDARQIGAAAYSLLLEQAEGDRARTADHHNADETDRPLVRSIEASLATRRTVGAFDVHVAGRTFTVQIRQAGVFGRQRKAAGGAQGTGPQRVVAPMPGKIVRVLVKPGDEVQARQGLVVVEAMKMENELRAGRGGRVREVAVAEGQSVEAGAVMVIVD